MPTYRARGLYCGNALVRHPLSSMQGPGVPAVGIDTGHDLVQTELEGARAVDSEVGAGRHVCTAVEVL